MVLLHFFGQNCITAYETRLFVEFARFIQNYGGITAFFTEKFCKNRASVLGFCIPNFCTCGNFRVSLHYYGKIYAYETRLFPCYRVLKHGYWQTAVSAESQHGTNNFQAWISAHTAGSADSKWPVLWKMLKISALDTRKFRHHKNKKGKYPRFWHNNLKITAFHYT
jgi:hypothetical protein